MSPLLRIALSLIALVPLTSALAPPRLLAQKEPNKDPKAKDAVGKELDFWLVRRQQQVGGAAQMVLARNPITALTLRMEGKRWVVWDESEFLSDTAPGLNQEWLDDVKDKTPRPNLQGKHPDELRRDQKAYHAVWIQAVQQALNTPEEAFQKSAQENDHVTFSHLYNNPQKYRGKVVTVQGRLARLHKIDLAVGQLLDQNIKYLYEGWVFDGSDVSGKRTPYFVHLIKIPEGMKTGESLNQWVTVHGYFLKLERYVSGDGSRDAPVVVGPNLFLGKAGARRADEGSPLSREFILGIVGFGVFMVALLTGLSWWFRRGDRQLQDRVAALHQKSAEEAVASAEQGLPMVQDDPTKLNPALDPNSFSEERTVHRPTTDPDRPNHGPQRH